MRKLGIYSLFIAIILLLLIGEIKVLASFSNKPWADRVGFVLQVIGFYGISIGFVQKSDLLKKFDWADDMASADPVRFITANLFASSVVFFLAGLGLESRRSQASAMALGCLGQILTIFMIPVMLLYVVVHLLLICPFAYVGYLFSSAVVEAITGSAKDIEMVGTELGEEPQKASLRQVIAANPTAAKSFLIGIPAAILAFVTRGIGLFLP